MRSRIFLLTHRNTKFSTLVLEHSLEDIVTINYQMDYINFYGFSSSLTDHYHTKVKYGGQNATSFMPYNSSRSFGIDAKTFKILNQMQRLKPRGLNKDTDIFKYLNGDNTVTEQQYSQSSCKWVKIALKAIILGVWGKNSHSFLSSSPG